MSVLSRNKTLCKAFIEAGNEGNISGYKYTCQKMGTHNPDKSEKDGNLSVTFIYVDGKKTITDEVGRAMELGNSGKSNQALYSYYIEARKVFKAHLNIVC